MLQVLLIIFFGELSPEGFWFGMELRNKIIVKEEINSCDMRLVWIRIENLYWCFVMRVKNLFRWYEPVSNARKINKILCRKKMIWFDFELKIDVGLFY